jgi:ADP-heptose:LPS heptosyltransferase
MSTTTTATTAILPTRPLWQLYRTIDMRKRRIVLIGGMGLGDDVITTGIIREIKKACPACSIDIRTKHKDLFLNNPTITSLQEGAEGVEICVLNFGVLSVDFIKALWALPLSRAHNSSMLHLLAQWKLNLRWNYENIRPDLHLGNTLNPVRSKLGFHGDYWLINSGFYSEQFTKWYPHYQEVVDLLRGKIQFIQHGGAADTHALLAGALSLVGQTTPLELAAAFRDCQGSLGGASSHAHFAAAFDRHAVIVAGGIEPPEKTAYENQSTLFKNIGCACANSSQHGWGVCVLPIKDGKKSCCQWRGDHAACMDAITPETVAFSILKYQKGEI